RRRRTAAQLTEHEQPPHEPPQLVRVGQRNPPTDTDVLRRILLEQVAHHPHEPAEQEPEQHVARAGELRGECRNPPRSARASASIITTSPTVKNVMKASGFIPVR